MKRLRPIFWCVSIVWALPGCFLFHPNDRSFFPNRLDRSKSQDKSDSVFLDIHPLSVSVGDPVANEELWTAADEQVLSPDVRRRLADNGLRVGVIRGRSDQLLSLIGSKRANPAPFQSRRSGGRPAKVPLESDYEICEFKLRLGDAVTDQQFEKASCSLQLHAAPKSPGKISLKFTPEIEFQDSEKWKRLNPGVALAVQGQRSTHSMQSLEWELELGADDYVLIGARLDRPDSLGVRFLVHVDLERPAQRILAIRAGSLSSPDPSLPDGNASGQSLAAQAGGN